MHQIKNDMLEKTMKPSSRQALRLHGDALASALDLYPVPARGLVEVQDLHEVAA